ncbi:MAG: cellulase family glycosylhydrolase, partial [Lachnospiraceae bacterium]
ETETTAEAEKDSDGKEAPGNAQETASEKEDDDKDDLKAELEDAVAGITGGKPDGKPATNADIAVPSTSGALHVEGTQLTDSNGKAVQLKGISTHGLAWFPDYVNEECFRQLREEWNVNVIRLAMYTAEGGGYCTDGNKENLKTLVKNGVEYATAQDMYVIIDWHSLSDNNPNTYLEEAKAFFKEMSAEYADYNNVIYEICNEPNGGTSWSDIKSYAEKVIEVIRTNDEDGIILVGTPNWAQYVDQAAADPITGYDNIMYTLHFYAATHTDWLRNTMAAAIDAGLPVFVSEYGICDASGNGAIDENQAKQWVDIMNNYGVSYVAWNLSNKNETSAILSSGCGKTSGFTESDLSASGKWLYQMLTGGAGTMAASSGTGQGANSASNSGNEQGANSASNSGNGQGANSASNSGNGQNTNGNSNSGNGTGAASSTEITLTNGDITYTAVLKNSWESEGKVFYQYDLTLENTSGSDCGKWAIDLKFSDAITFSDGWNGDYTVNGSVLHIASKDYNGSIPAGESVKDIGFIIGGSKDLVVVE